MLAAGSIPAVADVETNALPALFATTQAEGEPAPDLVAFARALAADGVQLFAAAWDADSTSQIQLFEDGGKDLPFIEVTGGDRELNDVGEAEEISTFPTWQFSDDTRVEGILTLAQVSEMSGVEIPTGEAPSFAEIPDQDVMIGSPLHIPIDAYDPNGDPLTITVSVEDDDAIEAVALSGNRSIRIDMEGFGDMVFELFEQRAPVPAGRVADLAETGFYDGIIFHRVADDFVIQTGDPTGVGNSGSELGFFDDQFHPDLQHNRPGVLSFAKTSDDTNNSQFFVTEVATRHLDFNHSIFGQLVEGDDVREAISEMEVVDANGDPPNHRPVVDIAMTTIDVFEDSENGVIMLKAIGDEAVTTSVTVTVTDSTGLSVEQTFMVSVVPDVANSQPFLTSIDVPTEIAEGETVAIQLNSIDIEGHEVLYFAGRFDGGVLSGSLDQATDVLTITPLCETGEILLAVAVVAAPGNTPNFDRQVFPIDISGPLLCQRVAAPTDVDGIDGPTARDALLIINAMADHGGEIDLSGGAVAGVPTGFGYNVNGDQKISALDALLVINSLAGGESQQLPSPSENLVDQEPVATDPAAMHLAAAQIDSVFARSSVARGPVDRGPVDRGPVAMPTFASSKDDELLEILAQYQLGLQTLR